VLAIEPPDGLDGDAAERPSSPNSYSGSPTGMGAPKLKIESAGLRSRGVSNPSSSA